MKHLTIATLTNLLLLACILVLPCLGDDVPLGWVLEVDGDRITTNIGGEMHVSAGTPLRVLHTEEVTHPRTGVVLETVQFQIAEAVLLESQQGKSIAQIRQQTQAVQPLDLITLAPTGSNTEPSGALGIDTWLPAGLTIVGMALTVHHQREGSLAYVRFQEATDAAEATQQRHQTLHHDRFRNLFAVGTTLAFSFLIRSLVTQ